MRQWLRTERLALLDLLARRGGGSPPNLQEMLADETVANLALLPEGRWLRMWINSRVSKSRPLTLTGTESSRFHQNVSTVHLVHLFGD